MTPKTLFLRLLPLLLPAVPLQAVPPTTAKDTFSQIATQLTSGDLESALKSMTPAAQEDYLFRALESIAATIALSEELPQAMPDGSPLTATAASLGLDTFAFPSWYMADNAPEPSKTAYAAFKQSLTNLLNKTEDRKKTLNSLYRLSHAIRPGAFHSEIISQKEDTPPSPKRLWVESKATGQVLALTFEKTDDQWLYSGIDETATTTEKNKFIPLENLEISGKTANGQQFALSDLKEKVVLIDFWGTW